jgi:DNA invertase Pin-like site-specific DNA recombinase
MFQMMGVFAEFERGMIRERVKAGLARAAANGRKGGRPRIDAGREAEIRTRLTQGTGVRKIASDLGVGVSVVQRIKNTSTLAPAEGGVCPIPTA